MRKKNNGALTSGFKIWSLLSEEQRKKISNAFPTEKTGRDTPNKRTRA